MEEQDLIEKIASTETGLRWTMHNCWPAQIFSQGNQLVVAWRDDLDDNRMTIKAGCLRSNVLMQVNTHRTVFRFKHASEGEVVLSCIHKDPVNKGRL